MRYRNEYLRFSNIRKKVSNILESQNDIDNEFFRNIYLLARGAGLAQFIPIIISPLLTRLFSPEQFGILAVYVAVISVLGILSTGRYEMSVMLPKYQNEAIQLIWVSLTAVLFVSMTVLLGSVYFADSIFDYLEVEGNKVILFFLPLSILCIGITQTVSIWLNRQKKYTKISKQQVIRALITGGTQLGSGALSIAHSLLTFKIGLIPGYFVGQAAAALYSIKLVFGHKTRNTHGSETRLKPNPEKMLKLAFEYRVFPFFNLPSALLNTTSRQMTPLLLGVFFTPAAVGFFALSQRIMQVPMMLLGSSVGQVYFQKANEIADNNSALRKLTNSVNDKLLLIGIFPVVAILIGGDFLFGIVFGDQWALAGVYAQYLALWIYMVFISSPLTHLLTVLGKQREFLFFNTTLFVARLGWFTWAGNNYDQADPVLIGLGAIGSSIWFCFIIYVLRLVGVPWTSLVKKFMPYLLIVLIAALLGHWI